MQLKLTKKSLPKCFKSDLDGHVSRLGESSSMVAEISTNCKIVIEFDAETIDLYYYDEIAKSDWSCHEIADDFTQYRLGQLWTALTGKALVFQR